MLHKGIEFEQKAVNLLDGEQKKEDYTSVNAAGQLPSLCIDGHLLTESMAIMEYLEETRADRPLLPAAPSERAVVRALSEHVACGVQPVQNLRVLKHVGKEQSADWARHWIATGFDALEQMLARTAGAYSFGDAVTMADCCLVPQVYNALRFKVDMSKYPTIARVNESLLQLDAFARSHPSRQPDCPAAERLP